LDQLHFEQKSIYKEIVSAYLVSYMSD